MQRVICDGSKFYARRTLLANVARYAIIVYAAFAAITQLGIAVQLTAPTFLIILGALALAATIAFGLGSREVAKDIVEKAYEHRDEAQLMAQQQGSSEQSGGSGGSASTGTSMGGGTNLGG
jgi:hypothetical protein